MLDTDLCRLVITSREAVPLVSEVAAEAANLLGISHADRTRLVALVQEVVEAIVRDAFEPDDELDADLTVTRTTGSVTFTLRDRGAPIDYAAGGYPPRVADLVRLGFADGLEFANDGMAGNRTEIVKQLAYAAIASGEEFVEEMAAEPAASVEVDAQGQAVVDIRAMTAEDVVGVARLFYRCYGYSADYAAVVYEPERLAEYVTAGRHFATVAVTPEGRIVGHLASEMERPDDVTGKIGLLAVEPAFRRHHLAARIGLAHATRLVERGVIGQFTEAVTVHLGSQRLALATGAHEVGLVLAAQPGQLAFRGFDGSGNRKAVLMLYGSLGRPPQRSVYPPPQYVEQLRHIYDRCDLPRQVHDEFTRQHLDDGETTKLQVRLAHETGLAKVTVERYGADFTAAVQQQVEQLRLNRFDLILVFLPLGDPDTAYHAAGLTELGLSFAGVFPEYHDGDVLVLQALNNVTVDPDEIQVASPEGEAMRDFVISDYRQAIDRQESRRRSRARMARIYEALR